MENPKIVRQFEISASHTMLPMVIVMENPKIVRQFEISASHTMLPMVIVLNRTLDGGPK